MLSTYPQDFIREQEAPAFTTPDPDAVEALARELAPKVCDFFEAEMRKTIPDFRLTHIHKPILSQADQNAEMVYGFVRDCEREREQ